MRKNTRRGTRADNLRVFVFNVGQGDHILLRLPNGEFGIIDFFYDGDLNPHGESPALTYLRTIPNPVIAFVHLTHYHSDHIEGIKQFFDWVQTYSIPVRKVWLPGAQTPETAVIKLAHYLKEKGEVGRFSALVNKLNSQLLYLSTYLKTVKKDVQYPIIGIQFIPDVDDTVEVVSLAPSNRVALNYTEDSYIRLVAAHSGKEEKSPNGNLISTVISFRLQGTNTKLLFGGDAEKSTWRTIFREYTSKHAGAYGALQSIWVKASHHGSKHSSFLKKWKTLLGELEQVHVAISAGKGYDHPHPETIKHIGMANRNAQVHITSRPSKVTVNQPEQLTLLPPPVTHSERETGVLDETSRQQTQVEDKFGGFVFDFLPGKPVEVRWM